MIVRLLKSALRACGLGGSPDARDPQSRAEPNEPAIYPARVVPPGAGVIDLQTVDDAVNDFRSLPNDESVAELCRMRRDLFALAARQPPAALAQLWAGAFREMHALVMRSGVRDLARSTEDERIVIELRSRIVSEAAAADLVGAMMFAYSHEMPLPRQFDAVPAWLRPDYAAYLLEMPQLFSRIGEADEYLSHVTRAMSLIHTFAARAGRSPTGDLVGRANLLQAYFNMGNLRELYAQRGEILSRALVKGGRPVLTALPLPRARQRLRLGIYAGHFAPHTETYFMISHFEHLDRSRFDITLYTELETGHALEQRCFACADRVVVLPRDELAMAVESIREAQLDILIIGSNATIFLGNPALLGAHRLARVQIASVSSPVTTGLRHIDVMLSAQLNECEADAPAHYTEYLYRMPGSVNCYAYQYDEDPPTTAPTRAAMGIGGEQLVFVSGANYFKVVPELSSVWARILAAVPDSVLILMPFGPGWSSEYQTRPFLRRVEQQMREAGVAPERLRFQKMVPHRADVHRILELGDVYLDAFPFAGACSMLDPLYLGTPPVARRGPTGRSSHGAAMLETMGLPDLVATSAEDYERLAISLAGDAARRKAIREKLLAARSGATLPPYFDTVAFSHKVGTALETLFGAYQAHYEAQRQKPVAALRSDLQSLADALVAREHELTGLTDLWLARHLVLPFLRAVDRSGRTPLVIDVGACHGAMSRPFLQEGWRAILFEPDPDVRQTLQAKLASYGERCTIVAAAAGKLAAPEAAFHKNTTAGLSGFADSPFGATERVIAVPVVRLADYCAEHGIGHVDFLKIDAEGYDFDVLEGFDVAAVRPRLIMVEFGTHFAHQSIAVVNGAITRMAAAGYRAIVFDYDDDGAFAKGEWTYRLTDLFVDKPLPEERRKAFGNIVFYDENDREFLLTVIALLDFCRPRDAFWAGLMKSAQTVSAMS